MANTGVVREEQPHRELRAHGGGELQRHYLRRLHHAANVADCPRPLRVSHAQARRAAAGGLVLQAAQRVGPQGAARALGDGRRLAERTVAA